MSPIVQAIVAVCVVVVTAMLVWVLFAVRRVVERAEDVLGMLDEELRRLVTEAHALTEDLRSVTRDARREIERVGVVTRRMNEIVVGVGGIVRVVGGVTRAGQMVSLAIGLKKGVDVFVHRLLRGQGDHHG